VALASIASACASNSPPDVRRDSGAMDAPGTGGCDAAMDSADAPAADAADAPAVDALGADFGDDAATDGPAADFGDDAATDGPAADFGDDAAVTYTVGGTVTGLTGTGLVLENNSGEDDLIITADGNFSFPRAITSGSPFAVTVRTQPSSPNQRCAVAGGAGTVGSADVTTVTITCVVFDCEDTSTITAARARAIDSHGSRLFFTSGEGYSVFNVYDLSTPGAPAPEGSLTLTSSTGCWYPGGAALAPGGNHAYIYGQGCEGLPVIDVTNRANPVPVSIAAGASGGSMDLKICGNMAYLAIQGKGVAVYDVSDPASPVFRGQSDIPGMPYPYGVTCATADATTDYVYLGDGGTNAAPAGLRIYEYNKSTHVFTARGAYTPTVHTWGGRGWPLSSTLLYINWSDTGQLALFDISNKDILPAPMTFPGAGDPNTQLLVTGNHLFNTYSGSGYGLGVFDISTPASPYLLYNKTFHASVVGLTRFTTAGQDYLAYTVNGGSAISVCHLINL
jgi:hypothetical protein